MNDINAKIKGAISILSLSKEGKLYISEPRRENGQKISDMGCAMQKEITKRFKTISKNECFDIFLGYVYKEIKGFEKDKRDEDATLASLLGENIDNLSNKMIIYCQTIPRRYIINFDIPLFHGKEIRGLDNLNYRISVEKGVDKSVGHESLANLGEDNDSYLNITALGKVEEKGLICKVNGLYSGGHSSAYHDALSILKIVVQQGLSRNIYVYKDLNQTPSPKKLMEWIQLKDDIKEIKKYYMYILDEEASSTSKEKLSDDISCFLNKLEVNSENELFKRNKEDYFDFLNRLNVLYEYVVYKEKNRFQNIFAAIEWCFDSYSIEEESETLSFLNVCFGLEALFSSGSEDKELNNVTLGQKLSLKCAYLISQNFDERMKIIKDMNSIYAVRSALVHGRRNRLNPDEVSLLHSNRTYLEKSIIKELDLRFVPIGY